MADDEAEALALAQNEVETAGDSWVDLTFCVADEAGEDARRLDHPFLTRVVERTLELAGIQQPAEVNVLVHGDEGLRKLNWVYRSKDEATDVLSFPLLDEPLVEAPAEELWQAATRADVRFITAPGLPLHLGDVAISYPTVLRQAEAAGHSALYEFAFLLAHGILHLIGFDDQTEAGYHRMVALQQATLNQMGIT